MPQGDTSLPYIDRVRALRETLEGWVKLKAEEILEFEGELDELRIRSEARATLLALREIHRLFPEVVQKPLT
jgi:tRNA A58 N-methylase Trm61